MKTFKETLQEKEIWRGAAVLKSMYKLQELMDKVKEGMFELDDDDALPIDSSKFKKFDKAFKGFAKELESTKTAFRKA
jgi:hypothetical protein